MSNLLSCNAGSTVVYPYNDTKFNPAELGASIFVDANKNLVRAAKEFGLEVLNHSGDETLGVWDGKQFLVTVSISTHPPALLTRVT